MKPIYFLSDAHLGSLAVPHQRMQERRLVRFLDSIKEKAAAVYLLGDMFDFWYEYKYVVPKGFTRFLGKLSELTDMGVEVHYFTGNTISGPMAIWKRSVVSFSTRSRRLLNSMARSFSWHMATDWAIPTSVLSSSRASSTTAPVSGPSLPFILAGACGSA